ncbi:MAG: hypothetical protein H6589_00585 [Flavobacteriales bacterium]|nr:hypothetical protein [Flavobacteriales bacterium]
MYGLKELKQTIKIENNSVECPVKNCSMVVERQKKFFKKDSKYKCPIHKIYISPRTFEYETTEDNLLWTDHYDTKLYIEILKVKRESRIARDNSEDALTWNVMRFLDKQDLLSSFLSQISNKKIKTAELILWSYYSKEQSDWSLLNKARIEFGETIARGSEPDIIILTDKTLYFIEAKLTAKNKTKPSNPKNRKKYEIGGNKLFHKIFRSDFETISILEERYELMRFWLLGCWMAKQLNLDFEFYSLVMEKEDMQIQTDFGKHLVETKERKYLRITWEQISNFIKKTAITKEKKIMIDYFENKTIGYKANQLIKAFKN